MNVRGAREGGGFPREVTELAPLALLRMLGLLVIDNDPSSTRIHQSAKVNTHQVQVEYQLGDMTFWSFGF